MTDWTVYRLGDPTCFHDAFERGVYLSKPAIEYVRCRVCHRELHRSQATPPDRWPEQNPISPKDFGAQIVANEAGRRIVSEDVP